MHAFSPPQTIRPHPNSFSADSGPPAEDAEYMQKLEDELDNRLADEALAEASEDVPIDIVRSRYRNIR